ncbi:hypothetical protein EW146_g3418 [Bondarzewia mesenterica]|uniref:Ubiquitin-like domain-containing protein n=1 Tax=Bondarzewia mesenterica TaxID=1095465 RepID=A0A4S4LZE6_9AGAM|nr:hypothetical protein EW146_g3418 [Bondarzewia mesenterica]
MNGVMTSSQTATIPRIAKPPPTGPAPPASAVTPATHPPPANRAHPPPHNHAPAVNGTHHAQKGKKKNEPAPVDPATMYESLKNRIAALEEEEVLEEEEERRFAEEAQKSVVGMEEKAIHAKYIELFAEFKRMERDHQKEKQKLTKDKDAAKGQLTKANQTKIKMENLARELQKDNKRLREDGKRLAHSVEEAQDEIVQMKKDMSKRAEKAKMQDIKFRDMPDIVVKVICRYREELFFRISRKTKLSKLFNAWTERMEVTSLQKSDSGNVNGTTIGNVSNGVVKPDTSAHSTSSVHVPSTNTQFLFTHSGRTVDAEQTPEEAGIDDGDEILAVELMDLTEGPGTEILNEGEPRRQKLKKYWSDNSAEAARTLEEIFDGVIRERLKEVLRQYELRERHFECVIRSKELEVLLSRARAAEQKQLAEGEKARADKLEEECQQVRKELEDAQKGQTMLVDRLITCCKEPNAERTQRLFASLREELEKRGRGSKLVDGAVGG